MSNLSTFVWFGFFFQFHFQFVVGICCTQVEQNLKSRRESQCVIWKFRNSKQFVLKRITV